MDSARRHLPEQRGGDPSSVHYVPIRAMKSFDNLVALANYQERMKDARKVVWRDRGEPAAELLTVQECLEHALKGGIRAGGLGYAMRMGFNTFLLLFRIWKTKRLRFAMIQRALFSKDCFRFAAMLGSFVSIYKFLLNSLPIINPNPSSRNSAVDVDSSPSPDDLESSNAIFIRRSSRLSDVSSHNLTAAQLADTKLSLRAQAHEVWIRKKSRRWHAALAGALAGGFGVMFETRGRRVTISQQLFVRGLQGSYNSLSHRFGFRIPHGNVIVFSLCCAQIMYAFLLRTDTLPSSYTNWILHASKASAKTISINEGLVRTGTFKAADMQSLIDHPLTTASNRSEMEAILEHAQRTGEYGISIVHPSALHPWQDSCLDEIPKRFFKVARWMLPVYGALHFVPMILFKRKRFVKNPLEMFVKAAAGTARSSSFLGVFVVIFQSVFCLRTNLAHYLASPNAPCSAPQWLVDIIVSRGAFWINGLLTGLSLFIEERKRRGELAMYVLPKGLESAWRMARGKGLLFKPGPYPESLLCAIGMGMVMSTYQNDPQHLSGLVRRILYQFIGPN